MQDRRDLDVGGEYLEQSRAYKTAKRMSGEQRRRRNMDQRTTSRRPGSGGQTIGYKGTGIQQMRNREIGQENERSAQNRPPMQDDLYDIYKTD